MMNNLNSQINIQNPILSSLVINAPYKFDATTTAPKVAKVFSLPFGFRADALAIFTTSFQFVFFTSLFMAISSVIIMSLYLPIQAQNNLILGSVKSLTYKQFDLQANLLETSSYANLYSNVDELSLLDSDQVAYVKTTPNSNIDDKEDLTVFKKYPTLQFSGF